MTSPSFSKKLGRLVGSYISRIDYSAKHPSDKKSFKAKNRLTLQAHCDTEEGSSRAWIRVAVTVEPDSTSSEVPYNAHIEAVVILEDLVEGEGVLEGPDHEEFVKHALLTGGPIAYGIIRDKLAELTARGPYKPSIMLPLVPGSIFIEDLEQVGGSGAES